MEDELNATHGIVDALIAPQFSLHDLDVVRERRQISAITGGKIVENAHGISTLDERSHQGRTDETGPTGDENLHAAITNARSTNLAKAIARCAPHADAGDMPRTRTCWDTARCQKHP